MKPEVIKEKLKVDLERLKISVAIVVLLTSGLVGLLFKGISSTLSIVLLCLGIIGELLFGLYAIILNVNISNLLREWEGEND